MKRFSIVSPNLYRGSAPSVEDVVFLYKKIGIRKIISLDEYSGNKINRVCKLLGIKHIIIPIDVSLKNSVLNIFNYDLYDLLIKDGPTFIHCFEGKDRTGLLIAIYRCKFQNYSYEKAIKEAEKYGFGAGLKLNTYNFYKKIIKKFCNNTNDINNVDIVENSENPLGQYRDYTIDNEDRNFWSPFADFRVRQYPYSTVYKDEWPEQYENRNNYGLKEILEEDNKIPTSGIYDVSTHGIMGVGPSLVGSGYI